MSFTFNPMWSYTMSSVGKEGILDGDGVPGLENLAISLRRLTEVSRRNSSGTMKRAHEVGEIGEPDIERDIGDGASVVGQQPRRMAQPGANQILVWCHAENLGEQPQKVKRAETRLPRGALEIDRLMRMRVDPERRLHRAAAIARADSLRFPRLPGNGFHEPACQQHAQLV